MINLIKKWFFICLVTSFNTSVFATSSSNFLISQLAFKNYDYPATLLNFNANKIKLSQDQLLDKAIAAIVTEDINLAKDITNLLLKNINHFEQIDIAGPGFLNIKLSKDGFVVNINDILKNKDSYGSKKSNKTYNIEFVSANPTGPMHVGHCRGAVFGDVLSNLLILTTSNDKLRSFINNIIFSLLNNTFDIYCKFNES